MELDESKAVFIDSGNVGYRMEELCSEDEHGIDIFFMILLKLSKCWSFNNVQKYSLFEAHKLA